MAPITPFKIEVPEEKIVLLKQKLALSEFPSEPYSVEPWSRGPPVADIKRLTYYWEHDFDWREVEASLNELPQYTTTIAIENHGTHQIHFIHQKSTVSNAIPLLFLHSWPGSFIEVTKILPELVEGGDVSPAFHVVAPSLIDFGFSSASKTVSRIVAPRRHLHELRRCIERLQHRPTCGRMPETDASSRVQRIWQVQSFIRGE